MGRSHSRQITAHIQHRHKIITETNSIIRVPRRDKLLQVYFNHLHFMKPVSVMRTKD